jgi:hypothetical protein
MPSWLQVTFRNIDASPAVEAKIRERARELEQFFDRIVSCRVVIEAPNRRRHGDLFHIRVDLKVPGKEIVVKRDPAHGRIASIMAERSYGLIETSDGAEVYFNRNAVANGGFGRGRSPLFFSPERGREGAAGKQRCSHRQASFAGGTMSGWPPVGAKRLSDRAGCTLKKHSRGAPMSTTGLDTFDTTVQKTNHWLKIMRAELGIDDRRIGYLDRGELLKVRRAPCRTKCSTSFPIPL